MNLVGRTTTVNTGGDVKREAKKRVALIGCWNDRWQEQKTVSRLSRCIQVGGGQLCEKYYMTPVEFHKQDFSDTTAQAWLIKKK